MGWFDDPVSQLLGGKKTADTSAEDAQMQEVLRNLEKGALTRDSFKGDISAELAGDNAYDNIKLDPEMRSMQVDALRSMMERSKDGYNEEDRAAINTILNETNQNARSQRAAAMQNAAARGMAGSGAEMANMLSANQAAATDANNASLQIAAQGRQRALQALMQGSNMARGIQSDDYERAQQRAAAQNHIQQFNASAKNAVNESNRSNYNNITNSVRGDQMGMGQLQYGHAAGQANRKIQEANAANAARDAKLGAVIAGGATAAGAYFGGPAGAKAGNEAGKQVSPQTAPQAEVDTGLNTSKRRQ